MTHLLYFLKTNKEMIEDNNELFYGSSKYPQIGEHVMVKIRDINDYGVYVNLIEYGYIEGTVITSEYSRRRINLSSVVKVGMTDVMVVYALDTRKEFIDLSKKQVMLEKVIEAKEKYRKACTVNTIIKSLSLQTNISFQQLTQTISWSLYSKYNHAYDAFVLLNQSEDCVERTWDTEIHEVLIKIIKTKFAPIMYKIRTDIELTCYSYHGVEGIKEAFKEGKEYAKRENIEIYYQLIASPKYTITCEVLNSEHGIKLLNDVIEQIKNKIESYSGELVVVTQPRIIGNKDEEELHRIIYEEYEKLKEIDGDEPSED